MKYAVTFCVLDQETGSNPFWHSCLLLSKWQETGKIEIVGQWGFYGLPTTIPNSLLKKVKIDVDLNGNHGMLRSEAVRTLDLGCGLHGATFELTDEKFKALQQRCQDMVTDQEKAISDVMNQQGLAPKSKKDTRIYPYEHWSTQIYKLEQAKAQEQQREPRLKPFELNLSLTLWGPSLRGSYTCKTQALSLLKGILTDQQLSRLTENGKHPTIPRFSGPLEKIFLHSTGPLRQHVKRSGKTVYYRDLEDENVKLYWTLPPQEMDAFDKETNLTLQVSKDYADEAKLVIRKLQRLEWLFRNASLPDEYKPYCQALVEKICSYYEAFSQINTIQSEPVQKESWVNYFRFLGSIPRNKGEEALLKEIHQAKKFLNALYMAIIDQWQIDLNCPIEPDEGIHRTLGELKGGYFDYANLEKEDIVNSTYAKPLDGRNLTTTDYFNPLEAVAAYLSLEDKKELCSILSRSYVSPEIDNNETNQRLTSKIS